MWYIRVHAWVASTRTHPPRGASGVTPPSPRHPRSDAGLPTGFASSAPHALHTAHSPAACSTLPSAVLSAERHLQPLGASEVTRSCAATGPHRTEAVWAHSQASTPTWPQPDRASSSRRPARQACTIVWSRCHSSTPTDTRAVEAGGVQSSGLARLDAPSAATQVVLVALPGVDLNAVEAELSKQCDALPRNETARKALKHSYAIRVAGQQEAIEFSNEYAPEHLIVNVEDAESWLPALDNAGGSAANRPRTPVVTDAPRMSPQSARAGILLLHNMPGGDVSGACVGCGRAGGWVVMSSLRGQRGQVHAEAELVPASGHPTNSAPSTRVGVARCRNSPLLQQPRDVGRPP